MSTRTQNAQSHPGEPSDAELAYSANMPTNVSELATLDISATRSNIRFEILKKNRRLDCDIYCTIKRCFDIFGGLCGMVVLGPIMLVAMALVWIEDGGPVIFRQKRVGLDGREFTMLKIRTMVKDAEARLAEVAELNHHEDDRTFKAKDDPRILRCGGLLRKFSIDEFPQLINVLRGEMTLVGPRPPLPREVDLYDPEDHVRFVVPPGLTCYWQISGRGEIPFKEHVALDRKYIEECSTATDLKVIAKTVPTLILAKGAH